MISVDDTSTTGFGIEHLPYGSYSVGTARSLCVRIGDHVLDLRRAAQRDLMPQECNAPNLDRLLAAGRRQWDEVRTAAQRLVGSGLDQGEVADLVHPIGEVDLHLPFGVADYVDFYSSEQHASNVGRMFRPDAEPLLPNWRHLPVGYHGRAGTVVVSGTPIARPAGQWRAADGSIAFGPSRKLDIELEMGVVLGGPTQLGNPVPIGDAADHIFGIGLLNDWSARDIQAWEYVPLGPFLGKSFATTLSPWITPLAALETVRCPGPTQAPVPVPYLRTETPWAVDLELEVRIASRAMRDAAIPDVVVATANFKEMYWTMAQQLAHMTVNGASVRAGDLYASGTISGADPGSYGSLLELTWNGRDSIELPDGSTRTFLEDGDRVVLSGRSGAGDIVLGDAAGTVVG